MQRCNSKSEQTADTVTKRGSKVQVSAGMLISYGRLKENQSLVSVISSFMRLGSKKQEMFRASNNWTRIAAQQHGG